MDLNKGFLLGHWTVYPLEGRLQRADQSQRVQPKSMDVLLKLAEAGQEVVSREFLLAEVWGGRAVTDEPLTRCIGELRRALGDSRSTPQYILTVPKRGYQLLEPAVPVSDDADDRDFEKGPSGDGVRFDWRMTATAAIGVLSLIVVLGVVILNNERTAKFSPPNWSIAVLPFDDVSPDSSQSYMSHGIADEVLRLLSRVNGLRVTSRSSAVSIKRLRLDAPTMARRLNVAYLLEGSVREADGRVRIIASLIDARSDTQIWSKDFDRNLGDIFAIQDEIAQSVVENLKIAVTSASPGSLRTDPVAYSYFLRARQLHQQPAGDGYQQAFEFYQASLAIDPEYTPAWIWLAALYDDTKNSSDWSAQEAEIRARRAIDRALSNSPKDPLALGMSSLLLLNEDENLLGAVGEMQRALEMEPNNPILLRWSVNLLLALARFDEAIQVGERLYAQDPLGYITRVNLAQTYLIGGEFEEAVALCRGVLSETDNGGGPCLSALILGLVYSGQGEAAQKALSRSNSERLSARLAPRVHLAVGDRGAFEQSMSVLEALYDSGDSGLASAMARSYAFQGDQDRALHWLTIAMKNGGTLLAPGLSYYEVLESNPDYQNLLISTGNSATQLERIEFHVRDPLLRLRN